MKVSTLDSGISGRSWSDTQRAAIAEEVNRVLSHPTFKGSKRCNALLSYLVDHALAGEEDGIKERTLGIEVFERSPDYDTNADPIVRRTANEIRKRLGQCYFEPHSRRAVRIHMDRGSYLLEFEFEGTDAPIISNQILSGQIENENDSAAPEEEFVPLKLQRPSDLQTEAIAESSVKPRRRGWIALGTTASVLAAVAYFLYVQSSVFHSQEYKLWAPLLASGERITVCVSDAAGLSQVEGTSSSQTPTPSPISHGPREDTPFLDTRVAQAISIRLLSFKAQTSLEPSSTLTFQDFRQRPSVLVGGTINPWGSLLLSKLRYTLRIDPVTMDKWIQDAQNPSVRNWKIDGKPQPSNTFVDYAVVTRFRDDDTGQWIMALSGLEAHGTEAAGQLVADPAFAKYIPSNVSSTGNFQIVLKAPVLRGSTGPFEVLTVYTW